MKARTIIILCLSTNLIYAQNNDEYLDYINLYNEALDIASSDEFIQPLNYLTCEYIEFIARNNSYNFGLKIDPFTGYMRFVNTFIIPSQYETEVYSITDGVIKILEDKITIKYKNFEVEYSGIKNLSLQENDIIKKGQLIGKITTNGYEKGPALILSIKYKNVHLNPYYFLSMSCSTRKNVVNMKR
jgi:murein DD-endopeptidase MepM/ murein hydrolase activator NlpD